MIRCHFCSLDCPESNIACYYNGRGGCLSCFHQGKDVSNIPLPECNQEDNDDNEDNEDNEDKNVDIKMEKNEFVIVLQSLQRNIEDAMEEFSNDNPIMGYFDLGALNGKIRHYINKFELEDGPDELPY